jgi:hypothetical protein
MLCNAGDDGIKVSVLAAQGMKPAQQIVFIGQHGRTNRGNSRFPKPEFCCGAWWPIIQMTNWRHRR